MKVLHTQPIQKPTSFSSCSSFLAIRLFLIWIILSGVTAFLWGRHVVDDNTRNPSLLRNKDDPTTTTSTSAPSLFQETSLVQCIGVPLFNQTCLFRHMYWRAGSPLAVVRRGSAAARQLAQLPPVHLYGSYDHVEVHTLPIQELEESESWHPTITNLSTNLTAAYACLTPHNIGHGIWDCLWPMYVGLQQLGVLERPPNDNNDDDHHIPFQTIMLDPSNMAKPEYRAVQQCHDITRAVALLGNPQEKPLTFHTMAHEMMAQAIDPRIPQRLRKKPTISTTTQQPTRDIGNDSNHTNTNNTNENTNNTTPPTNQHPKLYHMEYFAWGSGHRGQRNMNLAYQLPGAQYLQSFRDRTLQGFGLPPSRPSRSCSLRRQGHDQEGRLEHDEKDNHSHNDDGDQTTRDTSEKETIRVSIFHNKRYTASEQKAMFDIIHENQAQNQSSLDIQYVSWSKYDVRQQIKIISETDIYVSGPGTGIMFSPMARNGSVVINLGQWGWPHTHVHHPSYMEEYLVHGATYQRGLFYDRCAQHRITKAALWGYLREAQRMVRACEPAHHGVQENRSPIVKAFVELFDRLGLPRSNAQHLESNILPSGDGCSWAELLVFESPKCHGIWDRFQWNETEFRHTVRRVRAKHGLYSGACQRLPNDSDMPAQDNGAYSIRMNAVQFRRKAKNGSTR